MAFTFKWKSNRSQPNQTKPCFRLWFHVISKVVVFNKFSVQVSQSVYWPTGIFWLSSIGKLCIEVPSCCLYMRVFIPLLASLRICWALHLINNNKYIFIFGPLQRIWTGLNRSIFVQLNKCTSHWKYPTNTHTNVYHNQIGLITNVCWMRFKEIAAYFEWTWLYFLLYKTPILYPNA